MRRLTPLLLLVGLSGCTGFGEFVDHTFTRPGRDPNVPMADSENVRRVRGLDPAIQPIEVEPGNVWPKFDTREPTLEDVANNTGVENRRGFGPTAVPGEQPGLPNHRQPVPLRRGSSTPPDAVLPRTDRIPVPSTAPPPPTSKAPKPPGGVIDTPQGPAVDTGGTSFYRQLNTPSGPGAIVVPNGNGTSTVINPNGSIQTIPTPR